MPRYRRRNPFGKNYKPWFKSKTRRNTRRRYTRHRRRNQSPITLLKRLFRTIFPRKKPDQRSDQYNLRNALKFVSILILYAGITNPAKYTSELVGYVLGMCLTFYIITYFMY